MAQYILECIAFQLVFLIIYDLFLKRETFFQWNRVYLIGTYLLSLVLPWIKIEALKTNAPEVFQGYPDFLWNVNDATIAVVNAKETPFSAPWEYTILFTGMFLSTLFFGYKLFQIYKLRQKGEVHYFKEFTRIIISNSSLAFSFFKSIFLGDRVLEKEHQNILEHELVHIREKHSYDLLFFETMRIVGWFNPLVYIYQSRVSELHEYIADRKVAKTHKKEQYEFLLSQVFQTQNISFINQFFKSSLIKKRIVMLQKAKSGKIWQLKYMVLIPIVFGMLAFASVDFEQIETFSYKQTPEDVQLIAEIKAEINQELIKKGTLKKVMKTFSKKANYRDGSILIKREYFKERLLYRKMAEHMKVAFGNDVKTRKPFPIMALPSSAGYKNYVQYTRAFKILDDNLRISIPRKGNDEDVGIKLLHKNEPLPQGYFVFEVGNVKDLTGDEVRAFNRKIDAIFGIKNSEYSGLILTDSEFIFEILEAKARPYYVQPKREQQPDVIEVYDVQNLTDQEEKIIFNRLKVISMLTEEWKLLVTDKESFIKFLPSTGDSYITGPNGEAIKARQVLSFKPIKQELLSEPDLYTSNRSAIEKYDQLAEERARLLESPNEANPAIIDLDAQLAAIEKAALQEPETVPFAKVDEVPVFPGCENETDKRACFQKRMQRHISKNFRYPKEAQEKGIQGRVNIMFTMNTKGIITNLRMRGPNKLLEDEAARIIALLPKLKPGVHKGKTANVPFSIPITFMLQKQAAGFQRINEADAIFDKDQKIFVHQYNQLLRERQRLLKNANERDPIIINLDQQLNGLMSAIYQDDAKVPFAIVDQVPVFPGCEGKENKRACFNAMMQKHISKNFNYPKEAQEKGIQGKVNIMFTVAKEGGIKNLRMRGPDKILEEEAKRIVMRLPDMKAGRHKGKNIDVPFSIPITFKLDAQTKLGPQAARTNTVVMENGIRIKSDYGDGSEIPVLIDGKESSLSELESMSPNAIESMNVLKDANATLVYGEKGENGVIEIVTKKKLTLEPIYMLNGAKSDKKSVQSMSADAIESVHVLKGEAAIQKYGETAKNGVVEVITKKKK